MSIKQELRWEHTGIAWVAPASDAAGGSYLITGFERDAQGVRTFRAYHVRTASATPTRHVICHQTRQASTKRRL